MANQHMESKSRHPFPSHFRTPLAWIFILALLIGGYARADSVSLNADSAKLIYGSDSDTLTIDSGRPLMRAALILQALYGYVITYEDPWYSNSDDVVDIAPSTIKGYSAFKPGNGPKLIVPRSSQLSIKLPASKKLSQDELFGRLQDLVKLQKSKPRGGHFQVLQTGDSFHIIPAEARDRNGNWSTQSSLLDTVISLPQEDRTESKLYLAIAGAVSAAAKVSMTVVVNHPLSYSSKSDLHTNVGASNETARSVLMRALSVHPTKRTWTLMQTTESGPNVFSLNVMDIPTNVAAVSY